MNLYVMKDVIVGNELIELDTIDSTNDYAKKLIRESAVREGTVILADFQTKGKGQKGGYWESEKGKNLTLSTVLNPSFLEVQKEFYLSMSISIGIAEFLSQMSLKPKIKWPNDIYINNRKAGGILIENAVRNNIIASSIIGIGININQTEFKSNAPNPTSVSLELGKTVDIKDTLSLLLKYLDKWVNLLYDERYPNIRARYKRYLFLRNEKAFFTDKKGRFRGRIIDVEESGLLLVKTEKKEVKKYNFKEVRFPF
jgi:BirA family biotin operon repressor/biotin-[acetyl-CoA-carboxylase] ligase